MSNPVASIPSSSPSLVIPHEILGEILSHCDPCTLAVASRVSSACLELASPFLYTDIVVKDLETVIKLFRLSPAFGAALPRSDRVTPHTSLSIIHSITVHLEETPIDFDPLHNLALPPPLAIPVLVVSTPGPDASVSPRPHDLFYLIELVNPRWFILQGRATKLDNGHYHLTSVHLAWYHHFNSDPRWDRLSVVFISGVGVALQDIFSRRTSASSSESDPLLRPLRVVVDLVGVPEEQPPLSPRVMSFGTMNTTSSLSKDVIRLKAWVKSEGSKGALEAALKERAQEFSVPPQGKHTDVEIASDRALRFREDLALGARKRMDWAVLDEM